MRKNICGFAGTVRISSVSYGVKDMVLWPKQGLPIQPGPDEEAVVLGQVVMADFGCARVLDRLLVYERRIENSLYRMMAELRRERQARVAEEGQARGPAPTAKPCRTLQSQDRVARDRACTPTPGELGSFGREVSSVMCEVPSGEAEVSRGAGLPVPGQGRAAAGKLGSFAAEAKRTPDSGTTSPPMCRNHGRDARATEEAEGLGSFGAEAGQGAGASQVEKSHGRAAPRDRDPGAPGRRDYGNVLRRHYERGDGESRAGSRGAGTTRTPAEGPSCETKPISGGGPVGRSRTTG